MEVKRFEDVPDDFKPIFTQWYLDLDEDISFEDWLQTQGFEVKDENHNPTP